MKLAVFSTHSYDRQYLGGVHAKRQALAPSPIELIFHDFSLSEETVPLAHGADAVCVFVNDTLTEPVLKALREAGVRGVLLRCAGYNNVDLKAAERLGIFVANVPSYSPEAVAEFTVALLQTLNRNTHRAYNRVREGNFTLDGLLGKTLHGKTAGIVGLGRIGMALARILRGYGCKILACDPLPPDEFVKELGGEVADLESLLPRSDIVSLHCPLMGSTRHIINEHTLAQMKKGALLVNTSRGGLIHTGSVIASLKSKHLGGLALDVYEGEGALFYRDHSGDIIDDDELMRLMTFHNVIVCGHQAFFTEEALTEIAEATLRNMDAFVHKLPCKNALVDAGRTKVRRDSLPVRI